VEAVACAVRFARGSEYGSETAPLVLTGFSAAGGPPSHVAVGGESVDGVWEGYEESGGGPPAQYDCTFSEASTRVDGFVGIAGAYDMFVGYEGKYGRDFLQEHEPDLWKTLWGTVGLHPGLRVRLIHGESDSTIPFENSAAFETVLAEAGYDVELVEFPGGHNVPQPLLTETILALVE
jgi:pimeloyl-ACP methyl ester carboxylesterase